MIREINGFTRLYLVFFCWASLLFNFCSSTWCNWSLPCVTRLQRVGLCRSRLFFVFFLYFFSYIGAPFGVRRGRIGCRSATSFFLCVRFFLNFFSSFFSFTGCCCCAVVVVVVVGWRPFFPSPFFSLVPSGAPPLQPPTHPPTHAIRKSFIRWIIVKCFHRPSLLRRRTFLFCFCFVLFLNVVAAFLFTIVFQLFEPPRVPFFFIVTGRRYRISPLTNEEKDSWSPFRLFGLLFYFSFRFFFSTPFSFAFFFSCVLFPLFIWKFSRSRSTGVVDHFATFHFVFFLRS